MKRLYIFLSIIIVLFIIFLNCQQTGGSGSGDGSSGGDITPAEWSYQRKNDAIAIEDNSYFGYSVSISGDHAIVGASYEDGSGTDRGAVYIFYK